MKKVLFMSFAAILMTVCLVSCSKPTPTSITQDCIEYVKDGDYAAFAETIDGTEEERAAIQEMFEKKGAKTIEGEQGIASYEILSEEISEDGETAVVQAEITYGSGKKDKSKFNFKKVDGEWKQVIKK